MWGPNRNQRAISSLPTTIMPADTLTCIYLLNLLAFNLSYLMYVGFLPGFSSILRLYGWPRPLVDSFRSHSHQCNKLRGTLELNILELRHLFHIHDCALNSLTDQSLCLELNPSCIGQCKCVLAHGSLHWFLLSSVSIYSGSPHLR